MVDKKNTNATVTVSTNPFWEPLTELAASVILRWTYYEDKWTLFAESVDCGL